MGSVVGGLGTRDSDKATQLSVIRLGSVSNQDEIIFMSKMRKSSFKRASQPSLCYLLARRRRLGEERLQDVAHVDALVADGRQDGLGHGGGEGTGSTKKLKIN